ncbi:MAG TPA: baseplate J/gp47 family protein, partial [Anaerolineae bacterium]
RFTLYVLETMNTAVIYLDSDDDIISICDRLDWSDATRVVLVLPEEGGVLREGLDLVRLRRHADRLRLEAGLVTQDKGIARRARAFGFPTFATTSAAEHAGRGWWRGRRRHERVGLPTVGGRPLVTPPNLSTANYQLPTARRRWIVRYLAIFLFFVALSILFVSFTYFVPRATVILEPETRPLRVTAVVVADPALEAVDYRRAAVPGRLLVVTHAWQAEVETTGAVEVPSAPARGSVVFVNQQAEEIAVPAGTQVSTSDSSNVTFETLEEITLAGVVGSTAEVEVVAVEPGPQGNVDAGRVDQVQDSLADRVEVRNVEPIGGGGLRTAPAVTQADINRLRSQVLQFLQALAVSEMEAQLAEGEFLARDSLRLGEVFNETYSHAAGEQAGRLALAMRAELQGTAINATEAAGLAYEALAAEVPPGFSLVPGSLRFDTGEIVAVDDQGRVTFATVGEALVAADLDLAEPLLAITGQETNLAVAYLHEQLPVRDVPTIQVWPTWFDRVPYLPTRIQTEVRAGE